MTINENSSSSVGALTPEQADPDERDRAEQRDPRAVQLQERQRAQDHAQIHGRADRHNRCGHEN